MLEMDIFLSEFSSAPGFLSEIILSLAGEYQTKISKDLIRIQVKWATVSTSSSIKDLGSFFQKPLEYKIIMA